MPIEPHKFDKIIILWGKKCNNGKDEIILMYSLIKAESSEDYHNTYIDMK